MGLSALQHVGASWIRIEPMSPALAGRFFTWGEPVLPSPSFPSHPCWLGVRLGRMLRHSETEGVVAHGLALLWTPDFLHLPLPRLVLSPPYTGLQVSPADGRLQKAAATRLRNCQRHRCWGLAEEARPVAMEREMLCS